MYSRQLVVIAFALSAVCSWPVEAFACDCVGGPTRDLLRLADLVYTGRVTAVRVGPRYAWPEIEFSVDQTFKGKSSTDASSSIHDRRGASTARVSTLRADGRIWCSQRPVTVSPPGQTRTA